MTTANLSYSDVTGSVFLHLRDDEINVGPLDSCDDELPTLLQGELAELRRLVRESGEYGAACDATAAEADRGRQDTGRW